MRPTRDPSTASGAPRATLGELVRLGAPLSLAFAGNQIMAAVDLAVVGRLGAVPLAGVAEGNALFWGVCVLGMGLVIGIDPLVSQAIGAGEPARARRAMWQGIYIGVAAGLVLCVVLLAAPLALPLFGVPADVTVESRRYLWARTAGLPALLAFTALRSYLQAIGRTRPILVAILVANLLNAGVVTLLTHGAGGWAGLGVTGAGLATLVATLAQLGILGVAVRWLPLPVGAAAEPRARHAYDPVEARRAVRLGLPVGLHFVVEVGVFTLAGLLAARFGAAAVGGHQIALTLASLSFCLAIGFGAAGSVLVGRAIGAGDERATRRSGLLAFAAGAGAMAIFAASFVLVPGPLAGLLTTSPEVRSAAIPVLHVAALFQMSDGVQGVGAGVLRGAGDTRFTFVANLFGHWAIGLPLALLLGFTLGGGVAGMWWGLAAGLTVVAVAVFVRFWRLSARPIAAVASGAPDGAA